MNVVFGLIGGQNIIENLKQDISNSIKDGVSEAGSEVLHGLVQFFSYLGEKIVTVICIGIIFYIVYFCIRFMFMGNSQDSKKILFGYFFLLLARIFNTLLLAGWNFGINR